MYGLLKKIQFYWCLLSASIHLESARHLRGSMDEGDSAHTSRVYNLVERMGVRNLL